MRHPVAFLRTMKIPSAFASFILSACALAADPSIEALRNLGATIKEKDGVAVELQAKAADFAEAEYRLLGQCTKLRKLSLDGKSLNDTTLPLLAELTELEELSTNGSSLTDEGYKHFAPFQKLRALALWHPSFNAKDFTGAGLIHLKNLPKLERLTFAGATAGDAALEAISKIEQLREFHTWHTAQTQAGNEFLTKLPNLKVLRIGQRLPKWGTATPASLDATTIPTLAKIGSLESLEIFEIRLTPAALEPLKALKNLKKLSIHQSDLAEADVEKIRAALPGVAVTFKPMPEAEREETLVKKLKL